MKRVFVVGIPVLLLGAVALGGFALSKGASKEDASKKKAPTKAEPLVVKLEKAAPAAVRHSVDAVATIDSPFTVKLSPNTAGRIDYLEVREGDSVKKGQVLARIDPQEVDGEILQARGALAQAQHNLAQTKITENANTVGINSTINQNKAGVASAAADYNEAVVTYEAMVGAAHEATVDAQSKVRSAQAQVASSEANLKLAQANLADAKSKYIREEQLYKQGFVAAQDLDDIIASEKVDEETVNAQIKTVVSSKSALLSAEAEERAAENQEAITRKKGLSNIADVKTKLTQAKAVLESSVANRSQIPAYEENIRALTSAVVAAQASLDQSIAKKAYLIVTSSIDGTVTQRLAEPGAEASPGSPILVIQYLDYVFVDGYIPVEFADTVKVGTDVDIKLDAYPDKAIKGTVMDVNKAADQASRQFLIRVKLDNPDKLYRPGMYARITLVAETVNAPVAVPLSAVTFATNGTATVTVVDDKHIAHVTPVEYGVQDAEHVQINSGINVGDRVVVKSSDPVTDLAKVEEGNPIPHHKKGHGHKGAADDSAASASSAPATSSDSTGQAHHHRHTDNAGTTPAGANNTTDAGAASGDASTDQPHRQGSGDASTEDSNAGSTGGGSTDHPHRHRHSGGDTSDAGSASPSKEEGNHSSS